jgi:hypothetical protein
MQKQKENIFDFSNPISKVVEKVERTAYKKIAFLAIGIAILTTLGMNITHGIVSHFAQSDQKTKQEDKIYIQQIKKISNSDFNNFLAYMKTNQNNYDKIVGFVQDSVAKAENAHYDGTTSTQDAGQLGDRLDIYKQNILKDTYKMTKTRDNILNNIPVSSDDLHLFLKYYNSYQSHMIIRYKKLDNDLQEMLYTSNIKNTTFYVKNNIYEKYHQLQTAMNNLDQNTTGNQNTTDNQKHKP